jgi:voltage-gated potassium channel
MRLRRKREPREKPTKVIPEWRKVAFERFGQATEIPLLVLAVVMVPVLILPFVHHTSASERRLLDTIDYFIWAVFLLEYLTKLTLAPDRVKYVTRNVPDLVVVAVPMLRPLRLVRSARVLRLLRLSRLTAFAGEGVQKGQRTLASRSANYVVGIVLTLVVVCSVMVLDLERSAKGGNIKHFGDALWWAIATVTTVGYGDHYPVTPAGRAVATVLMFSGIALFGVLTAAIAAFFVQHNRRHEVDPNLQEILARLVAIEAALNGGVTPGEFGTTP